jgi:hypothetical protein
MATNFSPFGPLHQGFVVLQNLIYATNLHYGSVTHSPELPPVVTADGRDEFVGRHGANISRQFYLFQ